MTIHELEKQLKEIGAKENTDKVTYHGYEKYYSRYFHRFLEKPLRMLEIGVFGGGSLRLWRKIFPNALKIVGADIENLPPVQGCEIVTADANSPEGIKPLCKHGPFDIIIDDGGHRMHQHHNALDILWPQLNPGGIYVIEDLNTCNMPEYNPHDVTPTNHRLADIVKNLVAFNDKNDIFGVYAHPNIAFIEKKQ